MVPASGSAPRAAPRFHGDALTPDAPTATDTTSLHASALSASLTVSDVARSVAWYTQALGFTVDQRHEREGKLVAVSLRAGAVRLLVNQDDGAKGLDRVKGEGFSLQITTSQSIDAIAQRVRDAGGTLDSEPADMPWGVRAFRVKDPDGFRFAISSPRPG
jgi:uncharacterized glyoxalase superfamily protein PhnB